MRALELLGEMMQEQAPVVEVATPKVTPRRFTELETARIRSFLDKICASAEFARSEQMARLLRFLVGQAISSPEAVSNERTIALRVFTKGPDWDPREDTIVRTEARRLRQKLESYYEGLGRYDRVLIRVPKGSYYAQIEMREIADPDQTMPASTASDLPPVVSRQHAVSRPIPLMIAASVAIIISFCIIAFRLHEQSFRAQQAPEIQVDPIADAIGQEYSPSVSPDGKRVAYVWDGDGTALGIYFKDIAGGTPSRFTSDTRADLYPAWSPDGRSLAYLRRGDQMTDVLVRPVDHGPDRLITQIGTESGRWAGDNSPLLGNPGPSWMPDGSRLVVADITSHSGGTGLYSVSISNGERVQLTSAPGEMRDFYPAVSPDGKQLAFVRYFTHGFAQIFTAPIDTATGRLTDNPKQLTFDKQAIRGLAWNPHGTRLLFASNRKGQFTLYSLAPANGEISSIATNTSSLADPVVSANGILFVKTTENWNIWRAAIDSGKLGTPQRLLSSSGQNHDPMYSPDGSRIAFVTDRSGEPEIWTASQDGTGLRQVTNFRGVWIASPVWSPDGKYIGFDARPEGRACIYIVPSTGGTPKPLEQNAFENRGPVWSRDGRSIYFNSNRNGAVALWKKDLPDGPAIQVGPKDSYLALESNDGKELFYSDLHGNLFDLNLNSHQLHELPDSVHATPVVSWTVADGAVYFSTPLPDGRSAINRYFNDRQSIVGHTSAPMVINSKNLSISPDGKYMLYAQQDSVGSDILLLRHPEADFY